MKQLRLNIAAILVWLFFFYNIERLSAPINVASFVYIYAAISAVLILLFPRIQRLPLYWVFLLALPPFFIIKNVLGYQIGGENLAITVTEVSALWLTIVLAEQIGKQLKQMDETIANLTLGQLGKKTQSFEVGQGQIYREIRRARRYNRPATLLAVAAEDSSLDLALNKFIQDAQREIIHQYVAVRVTKLLMETLQDIDLITQRNGHFIALLPETGRESVDEIIRKLEAAAKEKLGIVLKIGLATFPDEAVTFESLLENAEAKMQKQKGNIEDQLTLTLVNGVN